MLPMREVRSQAMMSRLYCSVREEGSLGRKYREGQSLRKYPKTKTGCSQIQFLISLCNSIPPLPPLPSSSPPYHHHHHLSTPPISSLPLPFFSQPYRDIALLSLALHFYVPKNDLE